MEVVSSSVCQQHLLVRMPATGPGSATLWQADARPPHLATPWRPLGTHLAPTWRPPGAHLATPWHPPGTHLATPWRPPLGDPLAFRFGTTVHPQIHSSITMDTQAVRIAYGDIVVMCPCFGGWLYILLTVIQTADEDMASIRSQSGIFVLQGTLTQLPSPNDMETPCGDYRCGSKLSKHRRLVWYRAQVIIWTREMPSQRRSFGDIGDVMVVVPESTARAATLYVREEGDWVQRRQPLLTKRSSHVAHPGLPGRHLVPALGVLAWKSRSGARNVRDEFEKESVSVDNSSLLRAMYDDLLAQVSQRDSAEDPSVYSAFTPSTTSDNVDATLVSPSLLAEAARQYSAMSQ